MHIRDHVMNKLIKATLGTDEEYIQYRQDHSRRERKKGQQWNSRNIGPPPYEVANEVDSLYSSLPLTAL